MALAGGAADILSGIGILPHCKDVMLVDMASYRPPDELRMVMKELKNVGRNWKLYMPETERLATKVLEKSGLSPNATYLPPAVHPCHTREPSASHGTAHYEAEMVMLGAVRELLDKTGTAPRDVDILITCASIWCATPSQSSMIVNHFGMREDVQSYHFGGMGCATGTLLMSVIKDLLRARPNSRLLFVASETTSFAFYPGMEVSRRVSNVIFRMGGTAVLFSNRRADAGRAKYMLQHHVRFHTSADDPAYKCISWSPDEEGHVGVYLGKDVVDQAGKALTLALTAISPKIMTWTQLAEGAANLLQRKAFGMLGMKGAVAPYQPDFGQCVDYFLIHAGGYAVLKGIQKGMKLPSSAMLPSFAALRDYGNTSASTTWYSFSYLETCVGVKQGQRIMQIGCGGGMKVAIAIWRCMRDVQENHKAWRHLKGPLTEADLPRSISESAKLAAALKAGQEAAAAAAPAGAKSPPAAAAAGAGKPAAAAALPNGKLLSTSTLDLKAGAELYASASVDIKGPAAAAGRAVTVRASAVVQPAPATAAPAPAPAPAAAPAGAADESCSSGADSDSNSVGCNVTGVAKQQSDIPRTPQEPHVSKFDEDPEEYEFHL